MIYEEISPAAAAVIIPALWALAAYKCWRLTTRTTNVDADAGDSQHPVTSTSSAQ